MVETVASDIERLVAEWLDKHGVLYDFQSSLLGGRPEYGGIVADFILIEEGIVLRVQGEYWHHTTVEEEAEDREQRVILEAMGYRVVDLEEQDILDNLDLVMSKAMLGEEMSPIYTALHTGNIGMAKGAVVGNLGDHSKKFAPSLGSPSVRTDNYTSNELHGTLLSDGGENCDVRFQWGERLGSGLSWLCYIFPWKFYDLLNLFSPNIELDFGGTGIPTYNYTTEWQHNKFTGDSFSAAISPTPGVVYNVRADAKNSEYTAEGNERIFVG